MMQKTTLNLELDDENNTVNHDINTQDDTGLTDDEDSYMMGIQGLEHAIKRGKDKVF